MSTTKTKEELVRLSWLTELRRQGNRQCVGRLQNLKGEVCAIGLLREVIGDKLPEHYLVSGVSRRMVWDWGAEAGLNEDQIDQVIGMNDGGGYVKVARPYGDIVSVKRHTRSTFAEIADVVEGWFKP